MKHSDTTLSQAASMLLGQLADVLAHLDDDTYNRSVGLLSGSSIGGHVRHTLEFFTCLLSGYNSGRISYDERVRDLDLETDRKVALDTITTIRRQLQELREDGPLTLRSLISPQDKNPCTLSTTLDRELWYTIEHATHHFAIIKIGILSQQPDFSMPEQFGVASSTLAYQLDDTE